MLFNSIEYAIFLPIVFLFYWFIVNKNLKLQNFFLLTVSYVFYGWWDWRFLILIIFSSMVDYLVGIGLEKQQDKIKRKMLLLTSIFVNIGFLGFFKYYNFFAENFIKAFTIFGKHPDITSLNIILPVGISFYTFQTLSYSIDVYRKKFKPTKDIIAFFTFVAFFPQLVAGPIERATNLLPQFYKKRYFEYDKAVDGMRQMLWGLFKKIVIADNCARHVNFIFSHYFDYPGSTLLLGAILFTFQIYADFSGYSDIAIGTAHLFGFNLMRNFAYPYFSRDIAEYWRRWHISLTSWFRDYVYIPLGGSRGSTWMKIRNTFIIFLIAGFWHGANWTFIAWGFLNACCFLPLMLMKKNRRHLDIVAEGKILPGIKELFQISITFFILCIIKVFLRSESISDAFHYIKIIFSTSLLTIPSILPKRLILSIILFVMIEWVQRDKQHALQIENFKFPEAIKWSLYYALIIIIFIFGGTQQEFIYFQF
ncbi:MAG: MBOAT family protein [Atribacterota bacterium]|nr:MBOAT family protein [Atribacterota bacterium]